MSSGRAITFIFLSSAIMLTALVLQNLFGPQPPAKPPAGDPVAAVEPVSEDPAEEPASEDPVTEAPASEEPAQDPAAEAANPPQEPESTEPATEPPATEPENATPVLREATDAFVKLGSLAPDGSDRYLITINQRGGTLHQVELNARQENGRFRYRDMVFQGGYLGSWNLKRDADGLRVLAVGKATPAELAGVQPGDLLQAIDGEPMISAENVERWLEEKSKPGQSITLNVLRDGETQALRATLTEKPISIIRPEGGRVDPNFDYPESFVFSLVQPTEFLEQAWPDLDPAMRDRNWEVTSASNANLVELKFEISAERLQAMGLAGPLTVYKRYRLPELPAEDIGRLDSRTFHIQFEIEVVNGSDQAQQLAYELDGPTGITAETWWYANKIHGRQTAIGYIAGARDVVGSTSANSYVFYGCPEIVKAASKNPPKPLRICDPFEPDEDEHELYFLGVDSHYFNVSLIPRLPEDQPLVVNAAQAYPNNIQGRLPDLPKNARLQKLVDCTFQMVAPLELPAGGSFKQSFDVFCGPKEIELLNEYGLSDVRTFGWFSWCSIVLLWVLHLFYTITFHASYGLAIVMLTVLVRCIMIPFSRKAALNAQMMQHLAPQMKEIAEKYKDDMEKRANAQRELYRKYNFNPFGGCFMMFFQLPIFYGLYKGLNVDIALRDQPLIPGLAWCSNLAAPDQLLYWKSWMPTSLGDETGWLGPYLNILPLLTMVLFIIQQRLFTPPPTDDQQKFMQRMMTFMMIFMGVMFFKVPSGLCVYFITSSIWGIVERKLLPKPVLDTERFSEDGPVDRRTRRQQKRLAEAESAVSAAIEERKRRNLERKKRLKSRGQ